MPVDAAGELVAAALEAVGEVVSTEPPGRGRRWRYVYWAFVFVFVAALAFGAYLALG